MNLPNNLQDLKTVSEIFNNFAIGFAAIGGGFWALVKGIPDFLSNLRKRSYKNGIKNKYPRENLNKTFIIVDSDENPGKLYLVDLKKEEKYWIESRDTYTDLEFSWSDARRLSKKEFDKYEEGPGIWTDGTPGT